MHTFSQVLRLEMQHEAFVGGPVMVPGVLVELILGPGEVHRGERGGGEGRRGGEVFMASTHTVEARDASHTLRACMDKVSCLNNVESFTDCSFREAPGISPNFLRPVLYVPLLVML